MEQSLEKSYLSDLDEIKKTIKTNQVKALVFVNSAMIITYYQIGTIINERKTWGNKYIRRLAEDLKEYGRGYSYEHLKKMSLFASFFDKNEIGAQPVTQIPWGTILLIISKSSSKEEAIWYINQAHLNNWSRKNVEKQLSQKAFERKQIEPIISNPDQDGRTDDIVKDTLVLSFVNKNDLLSEAALKSKMMDNIVAFLQELGPGFALVGKEYKLTTPTNKNFYIDLLMYHTKIHAYVVIEVKIGEFSPADVGQLNFYVNAIDDLEKTDVDNETVGILLCKDADSYVAKTTMSKMMSKIGVSKYKIMEEIPEYLANKLNETN